MARLDLAQARLGPGVGLGRFAVALVAAQDVAQADQRVVAILALVGQLAQHGHRLIGFLEQIQITRDTQARRPRK